MLIDELFRVMKGDCCALTANNLCQKIISSSLTSPRLSLHVILRLLESVGCSSNVNLPLSSSYFLILSHAVHLLGSDQLKIAISKAASIVLDNLKR